MSDVVFNERKRKRVYALEEGLDYEVDDIIRGGYDPKKERKLVIKRLGNDISDRQQSSILVSEEGNNGDMCKAKMDKVWQDARIQSLLYENESNEPSVDDDNSATNIHHVSRTKGRVGTIRQSYIRLPDTAYSLLTVDQVLRRIMPTKDNSNNNANPIIEEIPSSFEIAGHIAHLNLREEALPYKYLIGKAILDKNGPKIKLVVNKIGNIENEFRTFPMEILAGDCLDMNEVETLCRTTTSATEETVQVKIGPQHESLMQVEVKEHGCRFQLDFARVYFNSRLQSEHARLVQQIVQDARRISRTKKRVEECIVADAMAGVGPFAIPLTSSNAPHYSQTKIICHANDLNPTSYEYLQKNAKLNKCYADRLTTYNLDGREFIHRMNNEGVNVDHFIMNLPQLAPEFLDAFRGWKFHTRDDGYDISSNTDTRRQPMIHVHCFGEKARCPEDIVRVERQLQERCEQALGCPNCFSGDHGISSSSSVAVANEFQVRIVRDVGPRKNMFCVTFRLPFEVEKVEKLVLAETGGDKNDECVENRSNGKRERKSDVNIDEDVASKPSKRSKES